MKKLKVNNKYRLKRTGLFCHCCGGMGFQEFSKDFGEDDTLEAVFIGFVNVGPLGSERAIFYNPSSKTRAYIMFGTENFDYVLERTGIFFKCDGCGENVHDLPHKDYDENNNLQRGIQLCTGCKFGEV